MPEQPPREPLGWRAARPRTHGDSIGTHLLDAWLAAGD
jgi:hypothetical protein